MPVDQIIPISIDVFLGCAAAAGAQLKQDPSLALIVTGAGLVTTGTALATMQVNLV
jgi:hypothetical protein